MEDGRSRELEEKVEMEVEQTEKTVEPESGRHAYGKLPATVGCAEDLTPCGWLGPGPRHMGNPGRSARVKVDPERLV